MTVRGLGLLVLAVLFLCESSVAQSPAIPDHPTVIFLSRPDVIVKLKDNSKSIRGRLAGLTSVEIMINRGKGQGDQPIKMERIESLKSVDGVYEFTGEEDIKDIAQRAVDSYAAIKITGPGGKPFVGRDSKAKPDRSDDDYVPAAGRANQSTDGEVDTEEAEPEKKPPANSSSKSKPKGMGKKEFGGIGNLSKNKKSDEDEASEEDGDAEMSADESESVAEDSSDASETLVCSSCNKEIPESARNTGVCPHCRATFVNTPKSSRVATKDPFAKTGNATAGAFAPTGPAPTGQAAPSGQTAPVAGQTTPATSNTVIVQGGGFSFDQVPNWAKGGIFVLVLLVGYHMLFNR